MVILGRTKPPIACCGGSFNPSDVFTDNYTLASDTMNHHDAVPHGLDKGEQQQHGEKGNGSAQC
jgi:hypothetical protein